MLCTVTSFLGVFCNCSITHHLMLTFWSRLYTSPWSVRISTQRRQALITNLSHQNLNTLRDALKSLCYSEQKTTAKMKTKLSIALNVSQQSWSPTCDLKTPQKFPSESSVLPSQIMHGPNWGIYLPCKSKNGKVKSSILDLAENLSTSQQLSSVIWAWKERTLWNRPD